MLLEKTTDIARLCRIESARNMLQHEQTMMSIIPNDTRWEWIFENFGDILKIKEKIINLNNNNIYLSPMKVSLINISFLSIFHILNKLTKEFQTKFLPISKIKVILEFDILRLAGLRFDASMMFVETINKRGGDIFATYL